MTASPGLRARPDDLRDLLGALLGSPVELEELKRKPGRRRTLRAVGGRRRAIVKVYESERAPTVGARVRALSAGPREPRLPEVLWVEPSLRTVVLGEVPGRPLRDSVLAGDGETCDRAGAALGAWHRFWYGRAPAALRGHTAEGELEILVDSAAGAPPAVVSAVRSACASLSGPWPLSTVVHRDLYEEQILVDERIGLIDLDDAAIGPPELDLGNLLAHLDLLASRSDRSLDSVAKQLLESYVESGPQLDSALLERCRTLTRLRLACIHDDGVALI